METPQQSIADNLLQTQERTPRGFASLGGEPFQGYVLPTLSGTNFDFWEKNAEANINTRSGERQVILNVVL